MNCISISDPLFQQPASKRGGGLRPLPAPRLCFVGTGLPCPVLLVVVKETVDYVWLIMSISAGDAASPHRYRNDY
jgi:hypothetical protein